MTRRDETVPPAWFEQLYAADPDPWQFATSPYERDKYAATLAALPPRGFTQALEIGCAFGTLTAQLAARCDRILAIDAAASVIERARIAHPAIRFEQRHVPREWPPGRFDLILASEVLYYLTPDDVRTTARLAAASLMPGGTIMLVHYLGLTDYPMPGDEAVDLFIAEAGLAPIFQSRTPQYRLDRCEPVTP